MFQKTITTLALGLLLPMTSFAAPAEGGELPRPGGTTTYDDAYSKERFERADTNDDGLVARDEANAAASDLEKRKGGKARFERADTNDDGALTLDEAAAQKRREREVAAFAKDHPNAFRRIVKLAKDNPRAARAVANHPEAAKELVALARANPERAKKAIAFAKEHPRAAERIAKRIIRERR